MSSESRAGLPKRPSTPSRFGGASLSSASPSPAGTQARTPPPQGRPGRFPRPSPPPYGGPAGLGRFNAAEEGEAVAALLSCCGSLRWARRVAQHRPYPDLDALLAAADEAGYDLSPDDLGEALAHESSVEPGPDAYPAARMALAEAHADYERRFHHSFVISLGGCGPAECLDQILADIRLRLSNKPDDERAVAAEELRGLVRSRLTRLVAGPDS